MPPKPVRALNGLAPKENPSPGWALDSLAVVVDVAVGRCWRPWPRWPCVPFTTSLRILRAAARIVDNRNTCAELA